MEKLAADRQRIFPGSDLCRIRTHPVDGGGFDRHRNLRQQQSEGDRLAVRTDEQQQFAARTDPEDSCGRLPAAEIDQRDLSPSRWISVGEPVKAVHSGRSAVRIEASCFLVKVAAGLFAER